MRRRRYHKIVNKKKKTTAKVPVSAKPSTAESNFIEPSESQSSSESVPAQTTNTQSNEAEQPANSNQTKPSEETEEEREEVAVEPQEETPATNVHGDICFPLVSSHFHGEKIDTTGLLVSSNGCGFLHTNAMPRNLRIPVKRAAPMIAAAHRGILRNLAAKELQRKVSEAFVTRARQGDQNAMAMIAMARDNANRGIPQAITAVQYMQDFITKNPVKMGVFGMEDCKCVKFDGQNAVRIANGPSLTNSRIRNVGASFGEDADIMFKGLRNWQTEHDKIHENLAQTLSSMQRDILKIGRTLGMARAIQIVRHPNGKIAAYSPSAAWELDE